MLLTESRSTAGYGILLAHTMHEGDGAFIGDQSEVMTKQISMMLSDGFGDSTSLLNSLMASFAGRRSYRQERH